MNVIDWLLDSDPAIRWQTMRDLTEEADDVVAAERAQVASIGWGADLLARPGSKGYWCGGQGRAGDRSVAPIVQYPTATQHPRIPEHPAMKYTVSIEIALPRQEVAQLLADPEHLPNWLRGLVRHVPLSGVHGQVGTKSRVVMQMGQQQMEATETITRRDPADLREIPEGSDVHFEREIVGEGMWSVVRDRLIEAGPDKTLWVSENEYRFSGWLMRLLGPLMSGAFRKQSLQHMQDFKAFAEQGKDVREAKD